MNKKELPAETAAEKTTKVEVKTSSHTIGKPHVSGSSNLDDLAAECRQYVKCDTARISKPLDKMFLIIGFNKNTKDDLGVWINQDNNRIDFDYVQEMVIASGNTNDELINSAKEYQRLCGINWEQYFEDIFQKNCR